MDKVSLRHCAAGVLFAAAALWTSTAAAADLIDATDPEAIYEMARGWGNAELSKDSEGDPMIEGRIKGVRYTINFYSCDNGRNCNDLLFNAVFVDYKVSMEQINNWNAEKRFGCAYLDSDGDAWIQMAVNMRDGVSRKNLDDTFDWWRIVATEFSEWLESQ